MISFAEGCFRFKVSFVFQGYRLERGRHTVSPLTQSPSDIPTSGCSIFMTSAPTRQCWVAKGPARTWVKSSILSPVKACMSALILVLEVRNPEKASFRHHFRVVSKFPPYLRASSPLPGNEGL